MKTFITLALVMCFTVSFGQLAKYGKVSEKGNYTAYVTKNNDVISVGDTLIIGLPTSHLGFVFISQDKAHGANHLANRRIIITELKSYGTQKQGYKIYAHFTGFGLIPMLIDYDAAFDTGEIINPKAKPTKKQATKMLKDALDLLNMEVINKHQFDSIKRKLTPIILS